MRITLKRGARRLRVLVTLGALLLVTAGADECEGPRYFSIKVVDADTGQGVPGVKLSTTHNIVIATDARGNAVFHEPGLMGRTIFFTAHREGYAAPKLFWGNGYMLAAAQGASETVTMSRVAGEDFDPDKPAPGPDAPTGDELSVPGPDEIVGIKIVDRQTKRGVPLVEIKLADGQRLWTDNHGWIAIDRFVDGENAELEIVANGYTYPKSLIDGRRGDTIRLEAGQRTTLEIRRDNIAQRLYRITGAGQYNHSARLGQTAPTAKPHLNAGVLGSDSVLTAEYKGELFWVWGDTKLAEQPIFSFLAPGATSALPGSGGLDPEVGVDLEYFTDETRQAVGLAPKLGPGPMWLGQLVALEDTNGNEQLFARYSRMQGFTAVETGILRFNDASQRFEKIYDESNGAFPGRGEPFKLNVDSIDYVYLGRHTRFEANADALVDPDRHQVYTPINPDSGEVEFLWDGTANFQWRPGGTVVTNDLLNPELHPWNHVRRVDDGGRIWVSGSGGPFGSEGMGRGRALWNPHRNRFVWIAQTVGQGSAFGELFYMEADTPMGPWVYAGKIVSHSHDGYSFYNPRHHPYLSPDQGKTVYLEATYTTLLTDIKDYTPRYAYNQIMYKLDVDDARVAMPVPVYEISWPVPVGLATKNNLPNGEKPYQVGFFALDRGRHDVVPVYADGNRLNLSGSGSVAFYALPATSSSSSPDVVELFEYTNAAAPDEPVYVTDDSWSQPGYVRSPKPLCKVWRNPMNVWFWPNRYQGKADGGCCN
jgi:hypothetical protein